MIHRERGSDLSQRGKNVLCIAEGAGSSLPYPFDATARSCVNKLLPADHYRPRLLHFRMAQCPFLTGSCFSSSARDGMTVEQDEHCDLRR